MGAYLSEPITEKLSSDETGENLSYGASSMQGWRTSQEDAHISIINFDKDTSLFAVFDGHGGHEVAQYTAEHFPAFIKTLESYKNGDMKQTLMDAFLKFDATLTQPEVIEILKKIAGRNSDCEDDEPELEENRAELIEEAHMPLEKVIEKYSMGVSPYTRCKISKRSSSKSGEGSSSAQSSGSSSSAAGEGSSSAIQNGVSSKSDTPIEDQTKESEQTENNEKQLANGDVTTDNSEKSDDAKAANAEAESNETVKTSNGGSADADKLEHTDANEKVEKLNGDKTEETKTVENGQVKTPSKGKELLPPGAAAIKESPKTKRSGLRTKIIDFISAMKADMDSDSEDSNDETFQGEEEEDSDGDVDDSSENADEEVEDEEDEEDDDDDEDGEGCCGDEGDEEFLRKMPEVPGSDSGCTAVVALLRGNDLYVANAGDSRCVISKGGKAHEMSFDHKPENEEESTRIKKAGGAVTSDGRVNGGLNLSRAFGDHAYKLNSDLPATEQMIVATPDIMHVTINPVEDEFMVLACDGIWNFMTSEQVIEFVGERLKQGCEKLSQICEEMFDHCLAPNTMGDGTGCDNMTAVIVDFRSKQIGVASTNKSEESAKRTADECESQPEAKRAKVDE